MPPLLAPYRLDGWLVLQPECIGCNVCRSYMQFGGIDRCRDM